MDLRRISAWIALRVFWAACILAAALALWSRPVPACEICVEDHIAATYDYGVVAKAESAGQKVLFVAVRGKDAAAPAGEATIRRALAAMAGVECASIRYSAFPSAASFAWNPRRASSGELLRVLNASLGASGLTLVALKVID
jgi:hypothetical protein